MKIITKTNTKATTPMFRYQIGMMTTRPERLPLYEERIENGIKREVVIGYKDTEETATVFHVLGCGDTLVKAKRMALA